jgi:hypothetical protein
MGNKFEWNTHEVYSEMDLVARLNYLRETDWSVYSIVWVSDSRLGLVDCHWVVIVNRPMAES